MYRCACLFLFIAACASSSSRAPTQGDVPPADSGTSGNEGPPAVDAGTPGDAGPSSDAGSNADGGSTSASDPPASIDAGPCPGTPPTIWSRTVTDYQADFRGAADDAGNLYWVEYQTATFTTPIGSAWLVSVDRDGRDRYRAPLPGYSDSAQMFVAGGKVVVVSAGLVSAYDAGTGARSWKIDLTASHGADSNVTAADVGNGEIAFGMSRNAGGGGVYLASLSTGEVVWSGTGVAVAGSNGAGSLVLVASSSSGSGSDGQYHFWQDTLEVDSTGREVWRHTLETRSMLSSNAAPWFAIAGTNRPSRAADYVAVPAEWFSAVSGDRMSFAVSWGATANTPDVVNVVENDTVIAQGGLEGTSSYNGLMTFPFLAGDAGDHLILVSQVWRGNPGLCHPTAPAAASIARFDRTSSWQCPLRFQQESWIAGAAMLPGRIAIGHGVFDSACGSWYHVQPMTIEAYELSGESLARAGWVQAGGSPGLGNRPLRQ